MLEMKNLSAGYGGKKVLQDISLRFEPGKIHTLVGRNGCGKTTLLKACAGLLNPDSGSILLEGKPLRQYAPRERACRIAYLAQSRPTPALSVERMVEHGRYPRLCTPRRLNHTDRSIMESAMERMHISHLRGKRLDELSGGEQQRVYLAMLLAQDAPVMLLDEPTAHMDVEYQLALLDLLDALRREGKCMIMVLHDLAQALMHSDTVIALENGRLVQAAPPAVMLSEGILERIFHIRMRNAGSTEGEIILHMERPPSSACTGSLPESPGFKR